MPIRFLFFLSLTAALSACLFNEGVDDTQKVAALRNVTLGFDSMAVVLGLPSGALSGGTFDDLRRANPTEYNNLANYSVTFSLHQTADNTAANADDARFSGMRVETFFDTLSTESVDLITPAFEIPKNTMVPVTSTGSFNLSTHKNAGKYIFRQMADGDSLDTKITPFLLYEFSTLSGEIPIPQLSRDIPTRASPEVRNFLNGLLDSGLLD